MFWSLVKQPGWSFCCLLSITQGPKEYESLQISKIACILQNQVMIKVNPGIGLIFAAFQWRLPAIAKEAEL